MQTIKLTKTEKKKQNNKLIASKTNFGAKTLKNIKCLR